MAMSRKHFTAIAEILCETGASQSTGRELARFFKSDNPAFKIDRFMTATKRCKR